MSQALKIFFDASIRNGVIGIGVYDFNNKEKISKTIEYKCQNSNKAELLALYAAMEYSLTSNDKTDIPMYFTDNMDLYKQGIPKAFEKRFGKGLLFWIPRELNTIADALSKNGSLVAKTSIKEMIEYGKDTEINQRNIVTKLKEYSLEKRINLIKKMFPEFIDFCDYFLKEKGKTFKNTNGKLFNSYYCISKDKKQKFKLFLEWINTIINRKVDLSSGSRKNIHMFFVLYPNLKILSPKEILKQLENFNNF